MRRDDGRRTNIPTHVLPTKLTAGDVAWIKAALLLDRRERRATGRVQRTDGIYERLAEKFGVTRWCIESIDRRRRWRRVEPERWHRTPGWYSGLPLRS